MPRPNVERYMKRTERSELSSSKVVCKASFWRKFITEHSFTGQKLRSGLIIGRLKADG